MGAHIGPVNAPDRLNTQADNFDILAVLVVESEGFLMDAMEIGPQVGHRRVAGEANWYRHQNLMSLADVANIGTAFQQDIIARYTFGPDLFKAHAFEVAPTALEILNRRYRLLTNEGANVITFDVGDM